jgi:UDP-2,4-diacetamido-2,4,6-trideoxy-beta-L-altropyranose hydrolase
VNVCIRTDASVEIGSGHVMRCLTLAETLRETGAKVAFLCRELPGNLIGYIEEKGFFVHRLPAPEKATNLFEGTKHAQWLGVPWQTDAKEVSKALDALPLQQWLVIDHYSLDAGWEKQMRPLVGSIMVIDDLADRCHECDLLLDQNLYVNMESRYVGLLPARCKKFLGPRYALLRPEFREARRSLRERDGIVRRILIFFGTSDQTNETGKALRAITTLNRPDISLEVIVGSVNPHKEEIKQLCQGLTNATYHCQVGNMAELMSSADLAIGAGGATTWERCYLELPSITVVLADNQQETSNAVAAAGASMVLGRSGEVTEDALARAISNFLKNMPVTKKMGTRAGEIMGNRFTTECESLIKVMLEEQIAAS